MSETYVPLKDKNGATFNVRNWAFTDGNGDSVVIQGIVDGLGTGTWGYAAGTSGTPSLPATARVREITCIATSAGTLTIDGGDSIPVPANVGLTLTINGLLTAPTLVFTGTASFFVQYAT